jgi:hypothetical protein
MILAAFANCRLKSVHCAIRLLLHVAEGCSCQEHPIQSSSSELHKSSFNGARLLFLSGGRYGLVLAVELLVGACTCAYAYACL